MPHRTSPARPFGALLTAMVTPMTPSGAIDVPAAVELAKHLAAHGHDGIVLNGTTGEAPATHAPEKVELVSAVVEAVGEDVLVLAGAGSRSGERRVGKGGIAVRPSNDGRNS